ncbi:MAG: MFS transporter [Ilumatobacteraceae bacterium]
MSETTTDPAPQPDDGEPTSTKESRAALPRDHLGGNYFKLFGASTISNLGDGIGMIAYPWLASAVTRDPLLIALVGVVQRLPWLVFSLPAGVITDRMSRRTIMIRANVARTAITLFVAFVVLGRQDVLPGTDVIEDASAVIGTDTGLYLLVLLATLLLGIAEVFYDNAAQTFMPSIVHADNLEKANGRLWSAELIANGFAGPPLGAFLIAAAFALPFFVDAATFGVSAALVALIPALARSTPSPAEERQAWHVELREGVRWLWGHDLLRPMAIILGILNALGFMTFGVQVLFAQEELNTSATEYALLMTGGAVGGVVGGWTASSISKRIGSGTSLWVTMLGGGAVTFAIGLMSHWPAVWLMFAVYMVLAVLWNVITVSLRQTIIPDHLLGRVNSVYRFFAWGMMPIGAILGGLIVAVTDHFASRELALRMPFFVAGVLHVVLFAYAAPKLTTAKIERARAEATTDT